MRRERQMAEERVKIQDCSKGRELSALLSRHNRDMTDLEELLRSISMTSTLAPRTRVRISTGSCSLKKRSLKFTRLELIKFCWKSTVGRG